MTVTQIEHNLIDQYRGRDYFTNPQISIELVNLRLFSILGEVEKRDSCPYVNGLTIAQAVAIGDGYNYRARRRILRSSALRGLVKRRPLKTRRYIRATSSELLSAFSNASAMFFRSLANRRREMGECSVIGRGKIG